MGGGYAHIIWDWNGTLLDDVDWCVGVMNRMLGARGMKPLAGHEEYHRVFCFPVSQYYKNVGLDFAREPFERLAEEYISIYHGLGSERLLMYDGAEDVLSAVSGRNIRQVILSASSTENLRQQTGLFGIDQYFDEILGISDIYAHSKVSIGIEYMKCGRVNRALMIGDTTHDYEVAQAIGAECVLIARGHQSKAALQLCGVPVLDDIGDVLSLL